MGTGGQGPCCFILLEKWPQFQDQALCEKGETLSVKYRTQPGARARASVKVSFVWLEGFTLISLQLQPRRTDTLKEIPRAEGRPVADGRPSNNSPRICRERGNTMERRVRAWMTRSQLCLPQARDTLPPRRPPQGLLFPNLLSLLLCAQAWGCSSPELLLSLCLCPSTRGRPSPALA